MYKQSAVCEVKADASRVTFSNVGALLIAWAVCYTLGSIAQSQIVLLNLEALGISINGNLWLEHTVLDWWGLLPIYGGSTFLSLTLAFFVAGKLGHWLSLRRNWLYPLAGGLSMLLMLVLMEYVLDFTLIAGTRDAAGLFWQGVAGVIGGELYRILRQDLIRWIFQRPKQNSSL